MAVPAERRETSAWRAGRPRSPATSRASAGAVLGGLHQRVRHERRQAGRRLVGHDRRRSPRRRRARRRRRSARCRRARRTPPSAPSPSGRPRTGSRPRPARAPPRSASRIPGSASIGPIEMTGFDGPITIASASAIACSTASDGGARSRPRSSTASIGPSARSTIMNSWKGSVRPRAPTQVETGCVAHRQHARAHAHRVHDRLVRLGERCARAQALGSQQAHREVAVAEAEPVRRAPRARARPSPARCRPCRPQPRSSISSASQ